MTTTRSCWRRAALAALALLGSAAAACADGGGAAGPAPAADAAATADGGPADAACPAAPAVAPGEGVTLCEGPLRLGEPAPATARVHDLGAAGARFRVADQPLTGALDAAGAAGRVTQLSLHAGFPGATPEGVAVGSPEAAVRAAYGEPVRDPFLGTWWYRERGLGFEWQDGAVSVIHVFVPHP